MLVRRSHLYLGLLLAPWAFLYGITGYLFNHPTHFAENGTSAFGRDLVRDTAMASPQSATKTAELVVSRLNERFANETPLQLDATFAPKYNRDACTASVTRPGKTINVQIHVDGSGGSVRTIRRDQPKPDIEKAWFAIRPKESSIVEGDAKEADAQKPLHKAQDKADDSVSSEAGSDKSDANAPLLIDDGLYAAAKASLPTILERLTLEFPASAFKLNAVPELEFRVQEKDKEWHVRYNSMTGAVAAEPIDAVIKPEFSLRKFLTRLHVSHGYPLTPNARWFWAIIVDVMSFVLVFWGVSGFVMWWQIKRTRPWGTVAVAVSLLFAGLLGSGMLRLFT